MASASAGPPGLASAFATASAGQAGGALIAIPIPNRDSLGNMTSLQFVHNH